MRRILKLGCVLILCSGFYISAQALHIPAKAWLSTYLIDQAWERVLQGHVNARPWSWMDSSPVAKLSFPERDQEHVVLSGVSGAILAFAPGWHDGTARPGDAGVSLIAAHKDTHFSFLKNLSMGEKILVQGSDNTIKTFHVESMRVASEPSITVENTDNESILILSTCYPFSNWDIGGQMRFVVVAREIPQANLRLAELPNL